MARTRRRRRTRTRRRRRRSRSGRISGFELVLVVGLLIAGFLAVREVTEDRPGGAGPAAPTTAPPARGTAPTTAPRPVDELLAGLTVAPETGGAGYEREAFGEGWRTQRDGCDTRERVLAEESRVEPRLGADGCSVIGGRWLSLYDGYSTPDPDELEIDHVVALAEAWESGASEWPAERRERFANDLARPNALMAVTEATNQAKSDQDPAEWMPPSRASWCRYAGAWITQKATWGLTVDPAERDALGNVLAAC